MKRTPLARRTPLRATSSLRRSAIKAKSRTRSQQVPDDLRLAVVARDSGRCRVCREPGGHIHHRVIRGMGGTRDPRSNDPRNLIVVCAQCHDDIHHYPQLAEAQGFILRDYDRLWDITNGRGFQRLIAAARSAQGRALQ